MRITLLIELYGIEIGAGGAGRNQRNGLLIELYGIEIYFSNLN